MKNVACPVCRPVLRLQGSSVECDEPACPIRTEAPPLELLAMELGVSAGKSGAETNIQRAHSLAERHSQYIR